MSFRRRRSKIRCCYCGRRGHVRTKMVRITEIHPDWKWKDDWVPTRHCYRCDDGFIDWMGERIMDNARKAGYATNRPVPRR